MVTRDVLKVLKLHSPTAPAILRTFKTSLVPINHEMHSRSYDFLYLQQREQRQKSSIPLDETKWTVRVLNVFTLS